LEIEKAVFTAGKYSKNIPLDNYKINSKFMEIESTPKIETWYSKRISFIESETELERKTIYFDENGKLILTVYRDFVEINGEIIMNYRYSIDNVSGSERLIYIPIQTIKTNRNLPKSFWNDSTLANL